MCSAHSEQAPELITYCKREGILLGTYWQGSHIIPRDIDWARVLYMHDCPHAEYLAKTLIHLPNHADISAEDAKRIIMVIRAFFDARSL